MESNQITAGSCYPSGGNRCPNCGYCPHCGRGGWPNNYWGPWYGPSVTLCGNTTTAVAGTTTLNNQTNNANTGQ